jgi:hypothetical protein
MRDLIDLAFLFDFDGASNTIFQTFGLVVGLAILNFIAENAYAKFSTFLIRDLRLDILHGIDKASKEGKV